MKGILLAVGLAFMIFPATALAKIGVGVGTGKIIVEQKLKPGEIYELPPLSILNTGDEPGEYEVSISHLENQTELIPETSWFSFTPNKFHLEPGKVQVVNVKLNLPVNARPGDYFAYLEGSPIIKTKTGQTVVGIAAAAKLYFTVVPANMVMGIFYRLESFWQVYSPWPQRVLMILIAAAALMLAKKFLKIEIGVKKAEVKEPKKVNHFATARKESSYRHKVEDNERNG